MSCTMSRESVPAFCNHKASGLAVVRINGHDRYLGKYGSAASSAAYRRIIAEWSGNASPAAGPQRFATCALR
jgi:hypothetical protein